MKQEPETRQYIITKMDMDDVYADYAHLSISDYGLENEALKELSPKRWIEISDCLLYPGHGEGSLVLGGLECDVTRALAGPSESHYGVGKKSPHTMLNWTVKVEPKTEKDRFRGQIEQLVKDIYVEEGGKIESEVTKEQWFKALGCDPPTLAGYRKHLEGMAKRYHESGRAYMSEAGVDAAEIQEMDEGFSPEGIERTIKKIGAMEKIDVEPLVLSFLQIREIQPWKLKQKKG